RVNSSAFASQYLPRRAPAARIPPARPILVALAGPSLPRVARLSVAAAECARWRESKSGLAAGAGARSASGLLGRAFRHIVAVASVELLCGRERSCAGMAPVAAGREPSVACERAGERVFGAVADGGRDRSDGVV